MHATAAMKNQARRKMPIRRILLIAIACFIVIEPIIMYRSLAREREQRQTIRQEAAAVPAGDTGR